MLISLLLLSCLPSTFSAQAEPAEQEAPMAAPVVVHMSPAMDAVVAPGSVTVTVEFDRPMDTRSMSWVTVDGAAFPKPKGQVRWITPTVCSFVSELSPNTDYAYSINGGDSQNFVGLKGTPAQVTVVRFRTGASDSGKGAVPRHERAADALIAGLQTHYSYRDQRDVDWAAWEAETHALLSDQRTSSDFGAAAAKQLGVLQDLHVWVEVRGKRQGTYAPTVSTNRHPTRALGQLQDLQSISPDVLVGRVGEDVGYILINNWFNDTEGPDQDDAEVLALDAAFKALRGTESLIIDVRPNGGGDEALAQHFAGHFVKDPVVYAKHRSVLPGGELGDETERVLEPIRPYYKGRVAVLQGPRCMSSNEAFLLMMQRSPQSRSFGESSFGSSGNPQPMDLGNDVTVYLPSWQAMTPQGVVFEGVGLAPDVPVAWTDSGVDPVLAAAIEWLGE